MQFIDTRDNFLTVRKNNKNVFDIVNGLNSYIEKNECENLNVDISPLNLIDATKVGVLCSTYHFIKYPVGQIKWLVKDNDTLKSFKLMALKNVYIRVKRPIIKDLTLLDNKLQNNLH